MENGPFIDDFPIKTSIYKGFSMAMLNNQMVCHFLNNRFHKWSFLCVINMIVLFLIKTKMKVSMCYYYLLIKNGRVNFQKCSLNHEVFNRLDATNQ